MPRRSFSQKHRSLVLFQLAVASSLLVTCGGQEKPTQKEPTCSVEPNGPQGGSGTTCQIWYYVFDGTPSECGMDSGLSVWPATCQKLCPELSGVGSSLTIDYCSISPCLSDTTDPPFPCQKGDEILECTWGTCTPVPGRRPRGLRARKEKGTHPPAARTLARMAYFEAASVPAFERLARELEAHGAPKRLRRAAVRASKDEVRHARIMTALAKRRGASVPKPRVRRGGARSLVAMAIENAVEGCVNETFAAAVAVVQSLTAADPSVRSAMRRIARDELRHAELAWSVAAWIEGRLSQVENARVTRARTAAASALLRRAAREPHPELVKELGMPTAPVARAVALRLASPLVQRAGGGAR